MTGERMEPQQAFTELGQIRLAETDLEGVLAQVAKLAHATLPSADDVSVTLIRGKRAYTATSTGQLAVDLDETQYRQGHGPCLDAAASHSVTRILDMRTEQRWPDYTPLALERGALSSLSVGLPVEGVVRGALNVYATRVGTFDEGETSVATTFAEYAAVALYNADLYDTTATLAHQMQEAMKGRAVIEQAKGIVMAQRACDPDTAFATLAKMSQDTNRKLRDVAASLVEQTQRG